MNIKMFLTLLAPFALDLVHLVEQAHPVQTPGSTKLSHALDVVSSVAKAVPELAANIEEVRKAAVPIINQAVTLMNIARS